MKNLLLFFIIFFTLSCKAQTTPTLENDTLYYSGVKVYNGLQLSFGYGSSNDKSFSFVFMGAGSNAGATDSKREITVDKIYKQNGKFVARVLINGEKNAFMKKRFIDIVGAIDNRELVFQSP
jgi:hypothetical protein